MHPVCCVNNNKKTQTLRRSLLGRNKIALEHCVIAIYDWHYIYQHHSGGLYIRAPGSRGPAGVRKK